MDRTERKLDELGRIVIPVEMRKALKWEEKDNITISVTERGIFLEKKEI
jgi:AbrB family looped-hinge helix DNA binding protein